MALLMLAFVIFCVTVIFFGHLYSNVALPFVKKKKSVEKPEAPALSYPEEFLNKIKESLPRGKGFIYEVSTSMDGNGDLIVRVNVIDPVEDKPLTTMDFDSFYGLADVTDKIETSMMDVYKRREIERLAGRTEIIS